MQSTVLELIVLLLLIIANGVLAMSELAIVSARKPRLQHLAEEGSRGAKTALELAEEPGQFLSTVQIGITLVGILAGAFGGATVARGLAALLAEAPGIGQYANPIAVGLVVLAVTYLSLVIGELAPKRIALRNPEGLAVRMAPPMQRLARWTAPLVRLLSASTDAVLRLLQVKPATEPAVTEEEVRMMLEQGAELGIFAPMEEELVGQVFRLADRKVGALLTPRPEMVWLDVNDPPETIREKVVTSGRSRFPVADGQLDQVLGIVLAKDLLAQALAGEPLNLRAILRPALFVPETTPALAVVERFKQTHSKLAIVIDEYGGVAGLVTVDDILAALVGDIPEPDEIETPLATQREDGSWLIDGMFDIEDFRELFDLRTMPPASEGYYQTVGGFVMAGLGQVPQPGDHFEWGGLRIEVVDMDGRRVDKVLVTRQPEPPVGVE
ncbi:MAG TPA: hemolysin family protein [Caldilineaceae bacterium]|nr:hemolysin family protein [Caldilineaceae bacterium]